MLFLFGQWLELHIATRHKIAEAFGIQKKGPTEVFNNTIKSDGYLLKDIEEKLNVDALQKYTGSDSTDMMILWKLMVDKAEGRVPQDEIAALVSETTMLNQTTLEPSKRFCDSCDSKGKRHKKECPKAKAKIA